MKKKNVMVLVLLVSAGFTNQLIAQEVMGTKKAASKSISSAGMATEKSSVVCTGKIRCGDGTCTIDFDQEIISPRDPSSGMATGKRMHKPFVITMELDKSSAAPVRESPTKASTGKVSVSDINIMVYVKGKSTKLAVVNGQFTMPADCTDGACDLIASWSWGESNSSGGSTKGSGVSRYQSTFNLDVVSGEYMASKHTKTGHVTLMK